MKSIPLLSKFCNYLILLFAFSFSVFPDALPILIILLTLSLITWFFIGSKVSIYFDLPLVLLMGLYLLYFLGILWTTDKSAGYTSLQTMLSFILFPILFLLNKEFFRSNFLRIIIFFILGCLVSVLSNLMVAFWESTSFVNGGFVFNTVDPNYATWEYGGSHFRYSNLSPYLHPTYYSAYLIIATIGSVLIIRSKFVLEKLLINILSFSVPIFLVMIYLLSSKAGIICTTFIILFYTVVKIKESEKLRVKLIYAISCLGLILIGIQNPRFDSLKEAIMHPEIVNDNKATGSVISRIHIWKAAIEVISGNFFMGVGTGDITLELDKKYESYRYNELHRLKANTHNQFLEIFLNLGIIGLLSLLAVFFYPINQSVKDKNIMLLLFLFVLFFNFLFESMLNKMSGSIFFSFFYCLLSLTNLFNVKTITERKILVR